MEMSITKKFRLFDENYNFKYFDKNSDRKK